MAITIIMPDGAKFTQRKDETMTTEAKQAAETATAGLDEHVRSVATVAAELELALAAKERIPALREELDQLLGRRRRGTKGAAK